MKQSTKLKLSDIRRIVLKTVDTHRWFFVVWFVTGSMVWPWPIQWLIRCAFCRRLQINPGEIILITVTKNANVAIGLLYATAHW